MAMPEKQAEQLFKRVPLGALGALIVLIIFWSVYEARKQTGGLSITTDGYTWTPIKSARPVAEPSPIIGTTPIGGGSGPTQFNAPMTHVHTLPWAPAPVPTETWLAQGY